MRCPACDRYVAIEDWNDDTPFECDHCAALLRLDTDEGTYCGATDRRLIVVDRE